MQLIGETVGDLLVHARNKEPQCCGLMQPQ